MGKERVSNFKQSQRRGGHPWKRWFLEGQGPPQAVGTGNADSGVDANLLCSKTKDQ